MPRYRTGRKVGHTLYDGERFIGSCVDAIEAMRLVELANAEHERRNDHARSEGQTIALDPTDAQEGTA